MNELTIIKPDDFHIHLRQGEDLKHYVRDSAKQFCRGVIMPNTMPPIATVEDVIAYKTYITERVLGFQPLMTFKILPSTRAEDIVSLKESGVVAGKYYPAGATTNSEDGISCWTIMRPVLQEMERLGMILSIHGEIPDLFILDREREFLPILKQIHREFPRLKIILEHVSSKEAVECINSLPENVVGTITLHHLLSTVEDVINDSNNKCMPIPKLPEDRARIREAAFSGNKKFFFGSDSAPHKVEGKIALNPKSGVYSAPVLLPKLVELFEAFGAIERLEDFVSKFGADFYSIPYNNENITLIKKPMSVPEIINGVRPYLAGTTIGWSLK